MDFSKLFNTMKMSDLRVRVSDDEAIYLHSMIVKMQSALVQDMLTDPVKYGVENSGSVMIIDMKGSPFLSVLKPMFHFMYCGEIRDLPIEKLGSLYCAAVHFRCDGLNSKICEMLMDSVKSFSISVEQFVETVEDLREYNDHKEVNEYFIAFIETVMCSRNELLKVVNELIQVCERFGQTVDYNAEAGADDSANVVANNKPKVNSTIEELKNMAEYWRNRAGKHLERIKDYADEYGDSYRVVSDAATTKPVDPNPNNTLEKLMTLAVNDGALSVCDVVKIVMQHKFERRYNSYYAYGSNPDEELSHEVRQVVDLCVSSLLKVAKIAMDDTMTSGDDSDFKLVVPLLWHFCQIAMFEDFSMEPITVLELLPVFVRFKTIGEADADDNDNLTAKYWIDTAIGSCKTRLDEVWSRVPADVAVKTLPNDLLHECMIRWMQKEKGVDLETVFERKRRSSSDIRHSYGGLRKDTHPQIVEEYPFLTESGPGPMRLSLPSHFYFVGKNISVGGAGDNTVRLKASVHVLFLDSCDEPVFKMFDNACCGPNDHVPQSEHKQYCYQSDCYRATCTGQIGESASSGDKYSGKLEAKVIGNVTDGHSCDSSIEIEDDVITTYTLGFKWDCGRTEHVVSSGIDFLIELPLNQMWRYIIKQQNVDQRIPNQAKSGFVVDVTLNLVTPKDDAYKKAKVLADIERQVRQVSSYQQNSLRAQLMAQHGLK